MPISKTVYCERLDEMFDTVRKCSIGTSTELKSLKIVKIIVRRKLYQTFHVMINKRKLFMDFNFYINYYPKSYVPF